MFKKAIGCQIAFRSLSHWSDRKIQECNFAAGCSREVIERGADILGWALDELITKTIPAMHLFEKGVLKSERF